MRGDASRETERDGHKFQRRNSRQVCPNREQHKGELGVKGEADWRLRTISRRSHGAKVVEQAERPAQACLHFERCNRGSPMPILFSLSEMPVDHSGTACWRPALVGDRPTSPRGSSAGYVQMAPWIICMSAYKYSFTLRVPTFGSTPNKLGNHMFPVNL